MQENSYLVCYSDHSTCGGMGFTQDYFTVDKKYKIHLDRSLMSINSGKLVVYCDQGWSMTLESSIVKEYMCTESEWNKRKREDKLKRILNDK